MNKDDWSELLVVIGATAVLLMVVLLFIGFVRGIR